MREIVLAFVWFYSENLDKLTLGCLLFCCMPKRLTAFTISKLESAWKYRKYQSRFDGNKLILGDSDIRLLNLIHQTKISSNAVQLNLKF